MGKLSTTEEWVKALICAVMLLMSTALVWLASFCFDINAENKVLRSEVDYIKTQQIEVVKSIDKMTDVITELKVTIEVLIERSKND